MCISTSVYKPVWIYDLNKIASFCFHTKTKKIFLNEQTASTSTVIVWLSSINVNYYNLKTG